MATYLRKLKDPDGNYIAPATRAEGVYIGDSKLTDVFSVAFKYASWTSSNGQYSKSFTCTNMKSIILI